MKTIVITGASDGIGAEMARQLAAQHKDQVALVLAARNETLLHAVADECTALGAQALVVLTDVSIEASATASSRWRWTGLAASMHSSTTLVCRHRRCLPT